MKPNPKFKIGDTVKILIPPKYKQYKLEDYPTNTFVIDAIKPAGEDSFVYWSKNKDMGIYENNLKHTKTKIQRIKAILNKS